MPTLSPSGFWLAALIAFCVFEAITAGLTSIWFALGALGAMIASGLGLSPLVHIIVFLVLSAVAMALVRPIAKKLLTPKYSPTNADRAIGKTAVVTQEINNLLGQGQVSVAGQSWTARSVADDPIPVGAEVLVDRIEGVKLFVKPMV